MITIQNVVNPVEKFNSGQAAVRYAVNKIGGPTQTGISLQINPQTVHQWMRQGFVPRFQSASKLAKLSGVDIEALRPSEAFR